MTCPHHWQIESSSREDRRQHGKCKLCGAERTWPGAVTDRDVWNGAIAEMGAKTILRQFVSRRDHVPGAE